MNTTIGKPLLGTFEWFLAVAETDNEKIIRFRQQLMELFFIFDAKEKKIVLLSIGFFFGGSILEMPIHNEEDASADILG